VVVVMVVVLTGIFKKIDWHFKVGANQKWLSLVSLKIFIIHTE
jgi:hypothetical protein